MSIQNNFYSQDGQDKFIVEKIFYHKTGGYFLDVGAYDGKTLSNTFYLENNLGWNGICVEANPNAFQQLKANRKCVCLNCCVSTKREKANFLAVSGWGIMLSGLLDLFDQRHLIRIDQAIAEHGGRKEIVEIQALPLKEILQDKQVKTIDYCNIDVEGGELSVLNSIDFSAVEIKIFKIENNYRSKEIRKLLKKLGYSRIEILGADEVYEKHSRHYRMMMKLKLKLIKENFKELKQRIKKYVNRSYLLKKLFTATFPGKIKVT